MQFSFKSYERKPKIFDRSWFYADFMQKVNFKFRNDEEIEYLLRDNNIQVILQNFSL